MLNLSMVVLIFLGGEELGPIVGASKHDGNGIPQAKGASLYNQKIIINSSHFPLPCFFGYVETSTKRKSWIQSRFFHIKIWIVSPIEFCFVCMFHATNLDLSNHFPSPSWNSWHNLAARSSLPLCAQLDKAKLQLFAKRTASAITRNQKELGP